MRYQGADDETTQILFDESVLQSKEERYLFKKVRNGVPLWSIAYLLVVISA